MEHCPITGRPCSHPKTFEISEIVDGTIKNFSLCNRCAGPYFGDDRMSDDIKKGSKSIASSISKLVSEFVNFSKGEQEGKCPSCGSTLQQIKENKCLGCLNCYEFFGERLDEILSENKFPSNKLDKMEEQSTPDQLVINSPKTLEEYVSMMENRLESAIKEEKYEIATSIHENLEKARLVLDKKKSLQNKLDIAVAKGQFDKAKKIKNSIELLVMKFFASHEF
jgi:protein arginine kinase activator